MWSLFACTLAFLFIYAAVYAFDSQKTAYLEGVSASIIPIRVDSNRHPYSKQRQFLKRGQIPWVGTVRYEWYAFSRTWLLDLKLYRAYHRRRHRVQWPNLLQIFNSTAPEIQQQIREGCYYTGMLRGDPMSFVGVNLCHGMTGDIYSAFGTYVIYPSSKKHAFGVHHLSSLANFDPNRSWRPLEASQIPFCDVDDNTFTTPLDHLNGAVLPELSLKPLKRAKRSESRELHLEVLVVADGKMAQYHGANLKHYILTLMATVALIYKDPSIGNNINIAVVDVIILDQYVDYDVIHTVAPTTLRKFCTWQQKHNHPDDRDPSHHDAAVLITREDLCRFPGACDTLGLAQSGMMCDPYSSCAIIEDNGLSAAFTIAHELGHVMSIPHDDDRKCSKYVDENKKLNVMARMLDYNSHPWSWSSCSRHYVTTFFDVGYGHCLMDRPARNLLQQEEEFQQSPGQLYSRDKQCRLVFGTKSRICPYMPECKRLWCAMDDNTQGGCRTQHMPWADGTPCENGKRCFQGECVRLTPIRLTPVDGQWGDWNPFGTCSRSCGGGIQHALRECDSPKPVNGGRYCIGVRVKYRSCNTQDCPVGSRDFREEQCADFNGRRLNFPGLTAAANWVPHYVGVAPSDYCKLYCLVQGSTAYFVLKDKVIDGTPCTASSYNICVNGHCEPAGCDHVLNSNKTLDRCGVCGGKNTTCREITGSFVKAVDYGYHDVVMIPQGASNIQIKQYSSGNETDDNYIVLKNPERNYILNGDYMISMFPKTLRYYGTLIDYSGSDSTVEKLNATDPLQRDLFVQVLIVGNIQPPQINFSYTVPISGKLLYAWEMAEEFTECSKLCNGMSYKKPVCVRLSDQRLVNDGHCARSDKPVHSQQKPCNQHCTFRWQDIGQFECSVSCGQGVRQRIIKCMKLDLRKNISHAVPEELCKHIKPKPSGKERCYGSCMNSTWVFGNWSQCSSSCGRGIQKRTAECKNTNEEIQLDSYCPQEEKQISRLCNYGLCPQWKTGQWTECSSSCGMGKRQRDVSCILNGSTLTENKFCDISQQPQDVESCNYGPCYKANYEHHHIFKKRLMSSMSLIRETPVSVLVPNDDHNLFLVVKGVWKGGEWSECSSTCGKGYQTRKITCHDPISDSRVSLSYCDPNSKPSQEIICESQSTCIDWMVEPWSECICPIGIKHRAVSCTREDQDYVACDPNHKPSSQEKCSCDMRLRHRLHRWESGPWSQCSATCGKGKRQRLVACVNRHGETVKDEKCPGSVRPAHEERCELNNCSSWEWSDWSPCSMTCGNGTQIRIPRCTDFNVDTCKKPEQEQRVCINERPCRIFKWRRGSWSGCSESCGLGYKTREMFCWDKSRRTDPVYCLSLEKPRHRKKCILKPCNYTWAAGEWSECSRTCGDGIMSRHVTCHRINNFGWIDPNAITEATERCDRSKRPNDTKPCNYGNCSAAFFWRPGKWTSCSGKCGRKRQKRKLACFNIHGQNVAPKHCNHKQKPHRRRRCNEVQPCQPKSCRDLQKLENHRQDGNYTIYVKGKEVSIYCHLMNSSEPQDYISVDDNNFSHIFSFGERGVNYENCSKGRDPTECDCNRDDKGLTKFSKIAINMSNLHVIATDFTFSHTYYGNPIAYGTAGDCIYTPRCPQGKFSISLKSTGFRVAEQTSWINHRRHSQKFTHRAPGGQVVRGICGGYCGSCAPNENHGLLLDIATS